MFVKTIDRRTYYGVRLSENVMLDSNGQLIAANVPIARTGMQEYMGNELNEELEQDKVYTVERLPEDVFEKGFIASLENKPFVDLHPGEDVRIGVNHDKLSKGYMRDIKPGRLDVVGLEDKYYDENGNNVLFADLVIMDPDMIDFVQEELKKPFNDRKIDLSLGYDAEYIQISDSGFKQVPKVGNHIARVPAGRAGIAKIRDNAAIDLTHNNEYFRQTLPWKFEGGLKKQGITKLKFVIMTPEEYYDELVYKAQTHFKDEVIPTDDEQIKSIIEQLNNGVKMDIPYVIYNTMFEGSNNQDGRHRVEAMRRLGVQNVPVLILYKTKEAIKVNDATSKEINEIIESLTLDAAPDTLINTAISAWEKVKSARSTSIKEATKIAGIINLLKAAKGKEQKEQLEALKKARTIGQEIKTARSKDEKIATDASPDIKKKMEIYKNQTREVPQDRYYFSSEKMSGTHPSESGATALQKRAKAAGSKSFEYYDLKTGKVIAKGTLDSKPYKIKFKDAIYEMHGFESKAEAKDYALIFHEIVRDATPEEILSDAQRKINWASKGMGEGMKAKQGLSNNWKYWVKEVKNGNWDVARTVKELKRTFGTKDADNQIKYKNNVGEVARVHWTDLKTKITHQVTKNVTEATINRLNNQLQKNEIKIDKIYRLVKKDGKTEQVLTKDATIPKDISKLDSDENYVLTFYKVLKSGNLESRGRQRIKGSKIKSEFSSYKYSGMGEGPVFKKGETAFAVTKDAKKTEDDVIVESNHANLVSKIIAMGKDRGLSDREAKSVVSKYEEIVGKNFKKMSVQTIIELITDII